LFTTRAHLKRAQRSLKKAHAELEERVAERTCELQNMNQQLEETLAKVKTLVKELECRNEELNLLGEMGGLLQSSQTNEEAFGVVTRYVQLLFPSESGGVFIFRSSRNALEAVATWGQAHSSQEIFPPGNCWALKRGKVHMVRGGDLKIACQHVEVSLLAGSGYMCVPLIAQGEVLGLLYLQQPAAPDTKGDNWESISKPIERLTTTMAEQISLAIANIQLRERLRDQAIRDPLTNLFNRRYMEETLEREIGRVSRKKLPLGIIMLDIDHFKRLNDKYGHDAGDTVLREISIFLHSHLRKEDIACRYGGEEFILILPGAELNITLGRAEELQQGIQRLNIESHGQVLGVLTISLGVVVFPDHGSDMDMLLQAVDEALYRAKAEGRNCVIVGKRIDA